MPSSKSSRSSKSASKTSLLSSLAPRSVHNLLQTRAHDRSHLESLGQPEKVVDEEPVSKDDESAVERVNRTRSRLSVLTSFFSPSPISSVKKPSLSPNDSRRPRTSNAALSPSHIRESAVLRLPAASALDLTLDSSFDDSPNTTSHTNGSVSTVDDSSEAPGLGTATPASQYSAVDFGLLRTDSPESADPPIEGQTSVAMPPLQKQQKGKLSTDKALPRVPEPRHSHDGQTLTMSASPELPKSRSSRERPSSAQFSSPNGQDHSRQRLPPSRRPVSPVTAPKVRSISAQPLSRTPSTDHVRTVSTPFETRPMSRQSNEGDARGRLRKSWLPGGGRSRSASKTRSKDLKKMAGDKAWVLSPGNKADYNTAFLVNGDKVPELWDDNGTVLVHLHPKSSNKGPSFKISAWTIEASIVFHELIQGELESSQNGRARARSFGNTLGADDAARLPPNFATGAPETESDEVRLYLPPPGPHQGHGASGNFELLRLIAIRNLFAFLTGQPLVATKAHPTTFSAFLEISLLLKEFDFMSMDGTTWGEAVDMSFGFYTSELALADVRHSREKTVEALILGERMKCWALYNEAYTHAVGKWQAIVSLRSPLMKQISSGVQQRLERANLDLLNRQHNVNQRLEDFEFPALFAGVANSSEFKDARAASRWKAAFQKMRGFTLDYYKGLFGSWPPKARSKKNPFSESGLNRLVLKALYCDLCSLYDLLVDRDSLTPRVIDQALEELSSKEEDLHINVLRKILTEFDTSSPPVLPPIPFDIPKVPTIKTVLPKYDEMKDKDRAKFDKNIKDYELQLIMHKSYNFDTDSVSTSFLERFKNFDMEMAKGKTSSDLIDNRMGIWLFLYVVIQSLPLLVIDAPDLQFTEGVEYFLCQPPMGNAPWVEDAGATRKAWYQIPGSSVKVELSPDVVMFSVEATFERSHCWVSARKWDEAKAVGGSTDLLGLPPPTGISAVDNALHLSPLQPPGAVFEDMDPVGYNSSNGGSSPASSAPNSPAAGPQRRVIQPGSGLAQGRGAGSGYRSSFAGLVNLEPILDPLNTVVDRRSSRVYSAQLSARSDTINSRPQSVAGFTPGGSERHSNSSENLRAAVDSPVSAGDTSHSRNKSSTFDDILKDIGNQKTESAGGKPVKKNKFGF
ncbi:unnamed protein product [Discula destructiva]